MKQKSSVKRESRIKINIVEKPLHLWDYLIFLVIALGCFFVFQHTDLVHTTGCSYGYLNGHILDFYDYCAEFDIHPSYLPSTYILFAIWNIPMKLLGVIQVPDLEIPYVALMWSKVLPCLFYLASGFLVYKISMLIGMESRKSKVCAFAFLTMPLGVFIQFIFGQYDAFMMFCVLLGVYYFLKNRLVWFVFWFGWAITFKYTALIFFLPLLLLHWKNIWKIIVSGIGVMAPTLLEFALYLNSPTFRGYAFGIGTQGDTPTNYIFNAGIDTGYYWSAFHYEVSLVILVFGVICGLAYFTTPRSEKEMIKWTFFLECLVVFNIFGLSKWHPQWLLLAVPFWVISAFINKNTKILMIIDIIFMAVYVVFVVQMFPNNVDQDILNQGILASTFSNGVVGNEMMMKDTIGIIGPQIPLSLISTIMLVYGLFKHPKYCLENFNEPTDHCMGWIRTRLIVGILFFVAPAMLSLWAKYNPPYATYDTMEPAHAMEGVNLDVNNNEVTQVIYSEGTEINKIQFKPAVYNTICQANVIVSIKKAGSDEILFQTVLDAAEWYDWEVVTIKTGSVPVENGEYYEVVFRMEPKVGYAPNLLLSAVYAEETDENGNKIPEEKWSVTGDTEEMAYIGDERQKFALDLIVYQQ